MNTGRKMLVAAVTATTLSAGVACAPPTSPPQSQEEAVGQAVGQVASTVLGVLFIQWLLDSGFRF